MRRGRLGRVIHETPWRAHEQTKRVGLLGGMRGSQLAVCHFRKQVRGLLVDSNSMGA